MPHVEEGQLHAWLDGAYAAGNPELFAIRTHVQDCADCRNRFDQAQALRERAGEILGLAIPMSVEPPAFEELTARKTSPRAVRSHVPGPARLAWAATIVLALGAGWIARGLLPALSEGDSAVMLQESAERASTDGMRGDAQAATLSAPTAPPNVSAEVAALPPATVPSPSASPEQFSRAAKTDARIATESQQRADVVTADTRVADLAAGVTTDSAVMGSGERRASFATRVTVAEPGPPVPAPPPAPSPPPALDAAAPISWQTSTLEQAREQYSPVLHVPDLRVETVAIARSGSSVLVRVTQTLPDKTTLELVHRIPVAEPQRTEAVAKAAPASAGAQTSRELMVSDATGAWLATIRRGNATITARAAIAPDSLRALLEKLR